VDAVVVACTALFLHMNGACASPRVLLGIDVLEQKNFAPLKGRRVGLVTNDAARDGTGRRTLDVLKNAPGVHLVAVFSPEHGPTARVGAGTPVGQSQDAASRLPVYSLYGQNRRPTPKMLKGLDALVLDLQDVGARFYTYATTMAYCLEESARAGIQFIVLDRPNPLTGSTIEGQILKPGIKDFTAYLRVPVRHGLTMGELARLHNKRSAFKARLTVIPMKGWRRSMWWEETGLPFNPPSPNIRSPQAALLYSGIGCFEATNVSAGRGTDHPFEVFGAPWLDSRRLAKRLSAAKLTGVQFKTTTFTPGNDLYAGQKCRGIQVIVKNRDLIRPIDIFVHAVIIISELHPRDFQPRWDEVAKMTGSRALEEAVKKGMGPGPVWLLYHRSARIFEENRKGVLIYGK
jgi:uncharacterized protein YbbC (DUF1343 family)